MHGRGDADVWEWEHGATTEGAVAMMCEEASQKVAHHWRCVSLSVGFGLRAPSTESRLGGRATTRKPSCVGVAPPNPRNSYQVFISSLEVLLLCTRKTRGGGWRGAASAD